MAPQRLLYRLVALDGTPHLVLDAPYESEEAALAAAKIGVMDRGLTAQSVKGLLVLN